MLHLVGPATVQPPGCTECLAKSPMQTATPACFVLNTATHHAHTVTRATLSRAEHSVSVTPACGCVEVAVCGGGVWCVVRLCLLGAEQRFHEHSVRELRLKSRNRLHQRRHYSLSVCTRRQSSRRRIYSASLDLTQDKQRPAECADALQSGSRQPEKREHQKGLCWKAKTWDTGNLVLRPPSPSRHFEMSF